MIEFSSGRLIAVARIARLAMVIELPCVPTTEPVVRSAKVSVSAGSIAEVMLMVPELVPPAAPMRNVPAAIWFSSVFWIESLFSFSDPRSISRIGVLGVMVTTTAEMFTSVPKAIVSASR